MSESFDRKFWPKVSFFALGEVFMESFDRKCLFWLWVRFFMLWSLGWGAEAGSRLGMGPGLGLGAEGWAGAGAGGPGGCWRRGLVRFLDWDIQNDITALDAFT